jgi:hypothetical protein
MSRKLKSITLLIGLTSADATFLKCHGQVAFDASANASAGMSIDRSISQPLQPGYVPFFGTGAGPSGSGGKVLKSFSASSAGSVAPSSHGSAARASSVAQAGRVGGRLSGKRSIAVASKSSSSTQDSTGMGGSFLNGSFGIGSFEGGDFGTGSFGNGSFAGGEPSGVSVGSVAVTVAVPSKSPTSPHRAQAKRVSSGSSDSSGGSSGRPGARGSTNAGSLSGRGTPAPPSSSNPF